MTQLTEMDGARSKTPAERKSTRRFISPWVLASWSTTVCGKASQIDRRSGRNPPAQACQAPSPPAAPPAPGAARRDPSPPSIQRCQMASASAEKGFGWGHSWLTAQAKRQAVQIMETCLEMGKPHGCGDKQNTLTDGFQARPAT